MESSLVALVLVLLWDPAVTVAELKSQQNMIAILVDDSFAKFSKDSVVERARLRPPAFHCHSVLATTTTASATALLRLRVFPLPISQQGSGGQQGQGRLQGGDIANGIFRGGGGGSVNNDADLGGESYGASRRAQNPSPAQNPEDTEKTIQQGLSELNQLCQLAKGDLTAEREIHALIRQMQRLDPSRFPVIPRWWSNSMSRWSTM
jgi:hypothetical protein